MQIERHTDAVRINEVLNHPSVRPWVADEREGVLDVSANVANPLNVLLMGEHGGVFLFHLLPGFYEVHTQVLPPGRGKWIADFLDAGKAWMYSRTDAVGIYTRVPDGHVAALTLTRSANMRLLWDRSHNALFRGKQVGVSIWGHTVEDWALESGECEEIGRAFHDKLDAFAASRGISDETHSDDPNHNRFVGATISMAKGGQVIKGVQSYNRWALLSRHRTVSLESVNPPRVRFDIGCLTLVDGEVAIEP